MINVAGHRLSTGQIEEVLASHDDVAECAVIGIADELKGQVPFGFLVLKAGVNRPTQDTVREVVQMVRDRIGPVAFFKTAHRRAPPAQDALGQDPARHHAEDRRRPAVEDAGHHRRPGRDRRDHRRAEDGGVCR